jgi:hypothetical protein
MKMDSVILNKPESKRGYCKTEGNAGIKNQNAEGISQHIRIESYG